LLLSPPPATYPLPTYLPYLPATDGDSVDHRMAKRGHHTQPPSFAELSAASVSRTRHCAHTALNVSRMGYPCCRSSGQSDVLPTRLVVLQPFEGPGVVQHATAKRGVAALEPLFLSWRGCGNHSKNKYTRTENASASQLALKSAGQVSGARWVVGPRRIRSGTCAVDFVFAARGWRGVGPMSARRAGDSVEA
jgi:hypothetical protein